MQIKISRQFKQQKVFIVQFYIFTNYIFAPQSWPDDDCIYWKLISIFVLTKIICRGYYSVR